MRLHLIPLFLLFASVYSQTSYCSYCKTLMSFVSMEVGTRIDEATVRSYVQLACETFGMQDYCKEKITPRLTEIFWALRSNETASIACQRLDVCQVKIVSITGNVLFTDVDKLEEVKIVGDSVQRSLFGTIVHTYLPTANIVGLACSPRYCAVLLHGVDSSGKSRYGLTAISQYSQVHHLIDVDEWYGPWYDVSTDEFWMARGTAQNYTVGLFDPIYGQFLPKVGVKLPKVAPTEKILSGAILDRTLYFTCHNDTHVYGLDLALLYIRGNFSTPTNTMLVNNPVTNILYGYSPNTDGIFKFNPDRSRTLVASVSFMGVLPVPASTIDPVNNVMWLSLWGTRNRVWVVVNLSTQTVQWVPVYTLEGLFDFNPFVIKMQEV